MLTIRASWDIPPLPGAQYTSGKDLDCLSFQIIACSRPPEPITRIFIVRLALLAHYDPEQMKCVEGSFLARPLYFQSQAFAFLINYLFHLIRGIYRVQINKDLAAGKPFYSIGENFGYQLTAPHRRSRG